MLATMLCRLLACNSEPCLTQFDLLHIRSVTDSADSPLKRYPPALLAPPWPDSMPTMPPTSCGLPQAETKTLTTLKPTSTMCFDGRW